MANQDSKDFAQAFLDTAGDARIIGSGRFLNEGVNYNVITVP